jgi:hypothetical protein
LALRDHQRRPPLQGTPGARGGNAAAGDRPWPKGDVRTGAKARCAGSFATDKPTGHTFMCSVWPEVHRGAWGDGGLLLTETGATQSSTSSTRSAICVVIRALPRVVPWVQPRCSSRLRPHATDFLLGQGALQVPWSPGGNAGSPPDGRGRYGSPLAGRTRRPPWSSVPHPWVVPCLATAVLKPFSPR